MGFYHLPMLTLMLLVAACCAGCGESKQEITTLRLEDVPPDLMKIAKEQLPGVAFDTVWKKPSGTFEIRGKAKNGKIREVDLRPDGTIEEVE
ncbi:MAG: hypothetical protein WCO99_07010 [Planctomycetota bacterium]